ncbi:hypothetical protein [Microbacterium sp. 2FI]|uniref:hypothetical protein n=1 Tax=Microbacterium sp. 2FI TaxID=2502193 RepID=UPI0010F58252|nr:hypothetical protein [Microbacterium sp. 2FI]
MRAPLRFLTPLLAAALLTGCAIPTADSNPVSELEKVIDLIPWAKSVAGTATSTELSARIDEITTNLDSLDLAAAKKADLEARLTALKSSISTDPADLATHVAELNAIIDELRAAM